MRVYLSALVALLLCAASTACSSVGFARRATMGPTPSSQELAIVRIPLPCIAPGFVVRQKFRAALPEYEAMPALDAKYFILSDDRRFGGIYLWRSPADAVQHFDEAWHKQVRDKFGAEPDVELADVSLVVDGAATPLGENVGARSMAYPAFATYVRLEIGPDADRGGAAHSLASVPWETDALIRGFVVSGPRFVGIVALWADRDAADAAVRPDALEALRTSTGATSTRTAVFEAPLLVDASLRGR